MTLSDFEWTFDCKNVCRRPTARAVKGADAGMLLVHIPVLCLCAHMHVCIYTCVACTYVHTALLLPMYVI